MIKSLSESQRTAAKYLFSLCSAALNNEKANIPSADIDLKFVFSLAKAHSLLNVLYYGAEKSDIKNEKMLASLREFHTRQLFATSNQSFEVKKLLQTFEENKIKNMPLKGYFIRELYPSSDMRSMSDVDLLYQPKDECKVFECLKNCGFSFETKTDSSQNFIKPPYLYVEMHTGVDFVNGTQEYFENIWNRASRNKDYAYSYKMNDEDLYIYHVIHTAKHFYDGGIGIRMVMDFYILNKSLKLDRKKVEKELAKLGLLKFENKLCELSQKWFSSPVSDYEIDDVSTFIITGGTFGRSEVSVLNTALEHKNGKHSGKASYLLSRIFVSPKKLSYTYKNAQKNKALYPVYLLRYWCNRAFIKKNIYASHLKNHLKYADPEDEKYYFEILSQAGLTLKSD